MIINYLVMPLHIKSALGQLIVGSVFTLAITVLGMTGILSLLGFTIDSGTLTAFAAISVAVHTAKFRKSNPC